MNVKIIYLRGSISSFYTFSLAAKLKSFYIKQMNFSDFLEALKAGKIEHITCDSRKVQAGSAFFLRISDLEKVKDLIREAKNKGAILVFHSIESIKNQETYVQDVDLCFSEALKALHHETLKGINIYGFTGTNGKTTTAHMLKNLLESYGVPAGVMGTAGNCFRDYSLDTGLTSPVAEDFYDFCSKAYKKGMRALVCEVSSHALDQKRLGLKFLSGAGFTSFSQDHLDYHKNMEDYLAAKKKIKTEALEKNGFFISHADLARDLNLASGENVILLNSGSYSYELKDLGLKGVQVHFAKDNKKIKGQLPLLGLYNGENFALALSFLCEHMGEDFFPDERVFSEFKQVAGRMERFALGEDSLAFVDFSHTPDSLEKAMAALKSEQSELVVVFGCGGDRDKLKRPLMGEVASRYADKVYITSDNPRSEDPMQIISEIQKGVSVDFEVIENRKLAILKALEASLKKKQVILIAGKGHEQTQESKGKKVFFSDQQVVLDWLKSKKVGV